MTNSSTEPTPDRRRSPQKRSRITRQRILDAARTVILTKGYTESTTQEIAQTAGVAEGSVFAHFGSKQGLLTGIMVEHYDGLIQRVSEITESQPDPSIRMMALIEFHVARLLDGWNTVRVFAQHGRFSDTPISREFYRLNREYSRIYVSCIDELKAAGRLDATVPSSLYRDMIFGTTEHWCSRTLELGQQVDRSAIVGFVGNCLRIGVTDDQASLQEITQTLHAMLARVTQLSDKT